MSKKIKELRDGSVWIELQKPEGDAEYAQRQCDAANKVLKRLYGAKTSLKFWVNARGTYNLTTSEAGTFLECVDYGHWFNVEGMENSREYLKEEA